METSVGRDLQADVARGAELFDRKAPDWFLTFGEVTGQDMRSIGNCALARVARESGWGKGYLTGFSYLFGVNDADDPEEGYAHGFIGGSSDEDDELARLWNEAANTRVRLFRNLQEVLGEVTFR